MGLKPNSTVLFCFVLIFSVSGQLAAQHAACLSAAAIPYRFQISGPKQIEAAGESQQTEFDEDYWREHVKDKTFDESDAVQAGQKKQRSPELQNKKQTDYSAYLWLIPVLLLLIVLLFKIIPLIRKRPKLKHKNHIAYTSVAESEEPATAYGMQALQTALQAGDFRLAFRLRYLEALRSLSERGLIVYRKDLSNGDYLQQLKGKAVYTSFSKLTMHFNATWYGDQPTDEPTYRQMDQYFKQLEADIAVF
jgi:Domain of unknown function (DUF4129)